MNIEQKLAEAKAELKGLQAGVKAAEAEAIERAKELIDEIIPGLEAELQKAQAQQEILEAIDKAVIEEDGDEEDMQEEAKSAGTIGAKAAEAVQAKGVERGARFSVKANADTHVIGDATIATVDNTLGVFDAGESDLLSFFDVRQIPGNAFTYFIEGEREGDFDVVAECGLKPQIHYTSEEKTAKLDKVAAYFKDSDELLEDAKWLADTIDNRALFDLRDKIRNYIVNAIATTDGIGAVTATAETLLDAISEAKMKVKTEGKMLPTLIIMNSADYEQVKTAKDKNGNYLAGSPFSGNNDVETLWGLPVRTSDIIEQGTVLVGSAFRAGTIFEKRAGESVEIANTNEDDFIHNMITVVAEKRIGVAVRRPAAWVKVTVS